MQAIKKIKYITLVIFVAFMLTITGVYASWLYAYKPPELKNATAVVKAFTWQGVEQLPEFDTLGENHVLLIENVLYEASYGLNATKKPIIHNYLKKDGNIIYSDQSVSGGNLKHILLDGTTSENLRFQVHRISATEYLVVTYAQRDLNAATVDKTRIQVFLTTVYKNIEGTWHASNSYVGTALVVDPDIVSKAIDLDTFVRDGTK
ncbi:MAG: hypothetical protein J6R88_01090 [Clostridia bacterium]|nr:hypothetical protein [Clostridia bacterium]